MALLLFLMESSARAQRFESSGGELKFVAIGKPGFLKINGQSKDLPPTGFFEFKDGKITGDFELPLQQLDTGIDLRNEHLKDNYLEVKKFPKALLKLSPISLPKSGLTSEVKTDFEGMLTLHGVQKKIQGSAEFFPEKKTLSAKFEIKLSDFDIKIPQYVGVTVSEKVQVELNLKMANKSSL